MTEVAVTEALGGVALPQPGNPCGQKSQHEDRTHIGLKKTTPARRPVEDCPNQARKALALPRIAGLHHRYTWSKAAY